MGQAGPLRWRAGKGWIILVGGGELEDNVDILRVAIEAMGDEAPVVYVPTASARPDAGRERGQLVVEQMEELGGPVGYVAPIFSFADAGDLKNVRRLTQAGLVYLGDGSAQKLVETLAASSTTARSTTARSTATLDALAAAFAAGAIVIAEGEAACALGAWGLCADGVIRAGWDWLPNTLIRPAFDDSAATALRAAVKSKPECLGLGIPPGVALALGPENQVQTLSASGEQVTVVLGPRLHA